MNPQLATEPAVPALMAHNVLEPLRGMLHAWHQRAHVPEKSDKAHKNKAAFLTFIHSMCVCESVRIQHFMIFILKTKITVTEMIRTEKHKPATVTNGYYIILGHAVV